jgi:hypothetical protein
MCEAELPDHLPESWIEEAERAVRGEVPVTFSEAPSPHGGPDEEARGVIRLVRATVFPDLGLEP